MSDPVIIAIVVSIGPTLVGLAGVLVSWKNRKQLEAVHEEVKVVANKITNGDNEKPQHP